MTVIIKYIQLINDRYIEVDIKYTCMCWYIVRIFSTGRSYVQCLLLFIHCRSLIARSSLYDAVLLVQTGHGEVICLNPNQGPTGGSRFPILLANSTSWESTICHCPSQYRIHAQFIGSKASLIRKLIKAKTRNMFCHLLSIHSQGIRVRTSLSVRTVILMCSFR